MKKIKKWAIINSEGLYYCGMIKRRGVHYDDEMMPSFSKLSQKTFTYNEKESASIRLKFLKDDGLKCKLKKLYLVEK